MPGAEHDVAILGGGLAGLSLAMRLAEQPALRILLIEPRRTYGRDRTWCSWRLFDHPFAGEVTARWTRWEVLRPGPGGRAVQQSRIPYEMIPSDRLYRAALERLGRAPGVTVRLGGRAEEAVEEGAFVRVGTDAGPIEASLVFDARPPAPRPGTLLQRFLGQEVETERDVFDPACATLMDFRVPQQPGAVRFVYVLPVSAREAMVEDTWFAPADLALPDPRAAIRDYLGERYGVHDYRVGFEEEGAIPMDPGLRPPGRVGRIVPIGTAGGVVKASTGYAFGAIQRMADALAADVASGRAPRPFRPRDRLAAWMDAVLIQALRTRPEEAPAIFGSLFARCRPEPLVRFLNDVGSLADVARVIAATPKASMIRAAGALALSPDPRAPPSGARNPRTAP